jgi:hypothetical protein
MRSAASVQLPEDSVVLVSASSSNSSRNAAPVKKSLPHLFPGDGLDRPGIDLLNSAFDFRSPCSFDVWIGLGFQRLNEKACQRRPVVL